MIKLTKERFLLVVAVIFLGFILSWVLFKKVEQAEWTLTQKPRTYYPVTSKEISSYSTERSPIAGRNPFVSATQKIEYVIDIPLPEIIEKPFILAGFRPFLDYRYYNKRSFRISLDKHYPFNTAPTLPLPSVRSLPSSETLQLLITQVHEKLTPATQATVDEAAKEDILVLKDGTKIKGKFISEEKDIVWFAPAGKNRVVRYKREDIADIQKVPTLQELYEMELKKLSKNDAYSWFRLAEWCIDKNLSENALMSLNEAIKINNREFKFYLKLADYYLIRNDFDNEIATYQLALQSVVVNKEIFYFRLGEIYERFKLPKEAQTYYEKAIEINMNYQPALFRIANLYRLNNNYEASKKIYEQLQNLNAKENLLLEGLIFLEYQMGNIDKAKEYLLRLYQVSELSSETLNLMGMVSMIDGDYSKASEYFIQSIYFKPDLTYAWVNLGFLYLLANLYTEAEIIFNAYIDLNPVDELPLVGLGYLKWLKKKPDEALSLFESSLKIAPDSFFAHYARGKLYFHQNKLSEARQDFLWCLSYYPAFPEILSYIAIISLYQNDYKQAIQYYKAYFHQIPAEIISASDEANFCLAFLSSGDVKQTKKILEKSARFDNYAPALNIKAYLSYSEKDIEGALKLFKQSLLLAPNNPYAKKMSDKIEKAASQSIWIDNFDRPDSEIIGQGWTEYEKFGVEISISNKLCLFKGTQSLKETGLTSLEKTVAKASFVSFEAQLTIDTADAVRGIYIATASKDQTLFVASKKQQIVYGFSNKPDRMPGEWLSFPKSLPPSETLKISLEAEMFKNQLEFHCFIDDNLYGIIPIKGAFGSSKDTIYLVGIFGYAPLNQKWQMVVKNVKIFEEKFK
jgi:tetratricopeptide (TPR) repeat protein